MKISRIAALLLIASLMLSLASCNIGRGQGSSSESQSEKEEETGIDKTMKERNYNMNDLRTDGLIKVNGRTGKNGDGIICDHSLAGFEANICFNGELSLTVTSMAPLDADAIYKGDEPAERTEADKEAKPADSYFAVYVDGERQETRFLFPEGETTTLAIATSDGTKTHHVRVVKETEPQFALATLEKLAFTGYIDEKPANKKLYIEVIGDSITTGYGNIWLEGDGPAEQALYQDGTQAYPFLIAEALNADISLVGCSGIGAVRGWRTFPESAFYAARSYYRDTETSYSSSRKADIVIISLGTNDKYAPSENGGKVSDADLKIGLGEFIDTLRMSYGDVPIVLVYGQMTSQLNSVMPELEAEMENVYAASMPARGDGGGGHPSAANHSDYADEMLTFLEEKGIID